MNAREILIRQGAVNPPYLTRRGRVVVCFIVIFSAFAGYFFFHGDEPWASFLASMAVTLIAILVSLSAFLTIAWRDVRKDELVVGVKFCTNRPELGSEFEIECTIENRSASTFHVESIAFAHSSHLEIEEEISGLRLLPQSRCRLNFRARAVEYGIARIVGASMLITDVGHWFRAECHCETAAQVDIVFGRRVKTSQTTAFLEAFGRHLSVLGEIDVPESPRDYQVGDGMRQILWRRYASRGDLSVMRYSRCEENALICVIDAGVSMRLVDNHCCNLAEVILCVASCVERYRDVTILLYDERGGECLVANASVEKALIMLERRGMEMIEWQPPTGAGQDEVWSEAASRLHRYFRLYRNVDFSKDVGGERCVDLKSLVSWHLADLASKLDDAERISEILSTPYRSALVTLIREKCGMPRTEIPPEVESSRLALIFPDLERVLKRNPASHLVWFSDFAMPIYPWIIEHLARILRRHATPSLGVMLPIPEQVYNLNVSRSRRCRLRLRSQLASVMDFVEKASR